MSYDRTNKQTNSEYNFLYIDKFLMMCKEKVGKIMKHVWNKIGKVGEKFENKIGSKILTNLKIKKIWNKTENKFKNKIGNNI